MSTQRAWLPREGFIADVVGQWIGRTILNPWLTLPVVIFADHTSSGRAALLGHSTAVSRLRYFLYFGLVRWFGGLLNKQILNNWTKDPYVWSKEVVVVTGGSGGIGSCIVKLLTEQGIKVAVLDLMAPDYDLAQSAKFFKCDITSKSAIAEAARALRAEFGNPTVLINNAGVVRGKSILDATEKDVRLTFEVNTLAHYWLVQEFLPDMILKNHGMIVTVASIAAYCSAPQMVDYCGSKAAALSFHEGLTMELKTRYNAPKVRTVLITPGFTRTPMFQGFKHNDKFLIPCMEPETVAEGVVAKVLSGSSGQVILPRFANLISGLRSWTPWVCWLFTKDLGQNMTEWKGRQATEPNFAKE